MEEIEQQKIQRQFKITGIVALVFSGLSVLGIGLGGWIGIFIGVVALILGRAGYWKKGKWMAWTAIIVGFIWGILYSVIKHYM